MLLLAVVAVLFVTFGGGCGVSLLLAVVAVSAVAVSFVTFGGGGGVVCYFWRWWRCCLLLLAVVAVLFVTFGGGGGVVCYFWRWWRCCCLLFMVAVRPSNNQSALQRRTCADICNGYHTVADVDDLTQSHSSNPGPAIPALNPQREASAPV